jgi:DNA-binding NarL/FixJ family response regulator
MSSAANASEASLSQRGYIRSKVEGGVLAKMMDSEESETPPGGCLLILDFRALDRECLAKALIDSGLPMDVLAMASIDEWRPKKDALPPLKAILLNIGARKADDPALASEILKLTAEFKNVPVVILSDTDDLGQILKALEYGARGYIPTSVGVAVCVEAIGLAVAGGIFIPASSFLAIKHLINNNGVADNRSLAGMFTLRQEEVVQALRKGKANKIIAFELNLRESTVKVHIRNIMKKLKATNRTEVAYKLNSLFSNASL